MKKFTQTYGMATIAGVALLGAGILACQNDSKKLEGEVGSALSCTPSRSCEEYFSELHCAEDADIVITLGENGLPYAFCQQVIER